MSRHDPSLAREFASALAWWQMAGVDQDFADDATAWLSDAPLGTPPAAAACEAASRPASTASQRGMSPVASAPVAASFSSTPAVPAPSRRDLLGESPPADLPAFRQWWMAAPGLDTARGFVRVPPRGEAGAALMVLVPQPEADDRERLLSGPQGRLLASILAAMGLEESAVYIAAALPSHTPMADLPALAAEGMDAVTLHHIALARPARMIAFGTGLAPMLGDKSGHPLREINYAGGKVPVLSSEALDALMDMPRLKARFWRRWMEWSV
jgi:DNA polymerase